MEVKGMEMRRRGECDETQLKLQDTINVELKDVANHTGKNE